MENEKLNILVANNHLNSIGGTETYTYTLIEELVKQGHNVEYFTFQKGLVSDKIEIDLKVKFLQKKKYDLILANHNTCIEELYQLGFIIQTCHGIYPALEQPSAFADAYVSISREIQYHLLTQNIASTVILNGINIQRFSPKKELNTKLKTVLSLCHSEEANKVIKEACDSIGVKLIQNNKFVNPVWNMEDIINEADMVIGLGRSAYDSMACGRPVVIYDNRGYMKTSLADGYVKDIIELSLEYNCSGRYLKKQFTAELLAAELLKYRKEDGVFFRQFSVNRLAIQLIVSEYITFYQQMQNKNMSLENDKAFYLFFKSIFGRSRAKIMVRLKKKIGNLRYKYLK